MLGFARTHGADQNSLGALESAFKTVPGQELNRDQALNVISSLMIDKQHPLDEQRYINGYKSLLSKSANPNMYKIDNARAAYRNDFSEDQYAKAQTALVDILTSKDPGMARLRTQILTGNLTPKDKERLDALIESHYGIKNGTRFIGNY